MKSFIALAVSVCLAASVVAADVEIAGMKSKTPDNWKEEKPSSDMRLTQFKLPKAEGDPEDAELIIFYFRGGSGDPEAQPEAAAGQVQAGRRQGQARRQGRQDQGRHVRGTVPGHLRHVPLQVPAERPGREGDREDQLPAALCPTRHRQGGLLPDADRAGEDGRESHKKDFEEFLKNFK